MPDEVQPDEVLIALNGPDIHPATAPARLLLQLASTYIEMLELVASIDDVDLGLAGIRIVDKCVGVTIRTTKPELAKEAMVQTRRFVERKDEVPHGLKKPTAALRSSLSLVPLTCETSVGIGSWEEPLRLLPPSRVSRPFASVTLRATPIKVGGSGAQRVTFKSGSEPKSFTLDMDEARVQEIGAGLHSLFTIEARVSRGPDGAISDGLLREFRKVGDSSSDTWRKWFRESSGEYWDDVDDIEAKLGRH